MPFRSVPAPGAGQAPPPPVTERMRHIYKQHLRAVYHFIYSKVGNREEAEDLTSQVFIKALRGIDGSRDAPVIRSWLLQIARTTIADHWRSFYRLPARSLDDLLTAGWDRAAAEPDVGASNWADERVRLILARLPERYREVLTYRFLLNYSIKETAARMHLTEANTKVLQFRALKKAGQVEEQGDVTPTPRLLQSVAPRDTGPKA